MNIHGNSYKGHASVHDPQNCIFQFHINNTHIKYMGFFFLTFERRNLMYHNEMKCANGLEKCEAF